MKSLGVKMVRATKDGLTYTAAQTAPSLPVNIGNSVHATVGLQPFRHPHKHSMKRIPKDHNRVALDGPAPDGPSRNIENAPPYLVPEILRAYNADGLSVTGNGQTIAIL